MTATDRIIPKETLVTKSMFKRLLLALVASQGIPHAVAESVDAYPSKPVTLIVPTAAGGGTDTMARLFATEVGKRLKQAFIVDNRPGANGILGTDIAKREAPDGYKLLFTYTAAMVVNPSLYKKVSYDPVKDFTAIAQIGNGGNLLLVRPDLPVKTVDEFVAYVKAHPKKLNYCSWGNGSGGHLAMESLKKQAGMDIAHVPYKGTGPCMQDMVGGQVEAGFGDVSSTVELVRSGRLRALATSGPVRLPNLPDVPTMTEAGYPFRNYSWYGVFAPTGTPQPIINKLNKSINDTLRTPEMQKRMAELNFVDPPIKTPAEFQTTVKQDYADWAQLVKSIGLTLD